jgi:hypothetical protein
MCSAFSRCQSRTQALHHGARPSLRERSRLNSAGVFSSRHFVQRFKSSEQAWAPRYALARGSEEFPAPARNSQATVA